MTLWFTADTHFGHANIIKYCDRPWQSVGEMNETLINNWNAVVRPTDTVWHLGDVGFKGGDPAGFLKRLNGKIHVCYGNHDKERQIERCRDDGIIEWCGHVRYLRHEGQRFFLSHYSHRVWPSSHHGTIHLYGHSHDGLKDWYRSTDVGVDTPFANYFPVSFDKIMNRMQNRSVTDHHPEMPG